MSNELDDLERELNALERDQPEIRASKNGRSGNRGFRILPILVAVLGLSGVGGVVYYAYTSGVKQGSEVAAPLLTPDGPAKVKPEDPGGVIVPHRDKSIYGVLEGENAVETVDQVEVLLPPPEDPMRPVIAAASTVQTGGDEDMADGAAQDETSSPPIPSITGQTEEGSEARTPALIAVEPELPSDALAAPEAPAVLAEGAPEPEASAQIDQQEQTAVMPAPRAPKQSSSEMPSQTSVPTQAPVPTEAPKTQGGDNAATGDLANLSLNGTWRIQIAALRSEAAAQGEWQRQVKRLPNILGALQLQVQKVTIEGKGDFYRVRGGPLPDKASADRLCSELKSNKVTCLSISPNR